MMIIEQLKVGIIHLWKIKTCQLRSMYWEAGLDGGWGEEDCKKIYAPAKAEFFLMSEDMFGSFLLSLFHTDEGKCEDKKRTV